MGSGDGIIRFRDGIAIAQVILFSVSLWFGSTSEGHAGLAGSALASSLSCDLSVQAAC